MKTHQGTAMAGSPKTRESLILRLPTASDAAAWQDFADIYEPLVYRFARRRGLQDADACELVQNVFVAVAKAIPRWKPDPEKGSFRSWLFRIARNQLINLATRKRQDGGSGKTSQMMSLYQIPDNNQPTDEIELDYRRELFRTAAIVVKKAVQDSTWQAFWMSSIENKPVDQVAAKLDITPGAVYIARSRVLARLRDQISQWETEET